MTAERAGLVVVAAGRGERLGGSRNKALVPLGGRPLVEHGLRRLLAVAALDPVVLVGHPDDRQALAALIAELPRPVTLVDGGARRQDSVAAGLAALDASVGIVLVHDAARPFVPTERVAELIERAEAVGAAVLAIPIADTIRRARPGQPDMADGTLDRSELRAVQTPQAFRRAELAERLAHASKQGVDVTDEAALYEQDGREVAFVPGARSNFKITDAEDLSLADAVVARARDAP